MLIKEIMKTDLFTLRENDKLSDITQIMRLKKIRHIPIVDKEYKLTGLVTYRELLRALASKTNPILVKDIMKNNVVAVEPETPLKGVIDTMIINKFGCMPVVDKDRKLLGMVTEIDLLKILYDMTPLPPDFYKVKQKST